MQEEMVAPSAGAPSGGGGAGGHGTGAAGGTGTMTQRNGKLPLLKFDNGGSHEGEWFNGKMHGRGIYTWANKDR
jgi:hypothetical protein